VVFYHSFILNIMFSFVDALLQENDERGLPVILRVRLCVFG